MKPKRPADNRKPSSSPSEPSPETVYTPKQLSDLNIDYERDLGAPGTFPFTRGIYPQMYRRRPWTMRQYAGYGSATESNRRYQYLLSQGQAGLSDPPVGRTRIIAEPDEDSLAEIANSR